MKKNILIISICTMVLSLTSIAYSSEGIYVGAEFGLAIANNTDLTEPMATGFIDLEPGFAMKIAVGYRFKNTRMEGEISYHGNDFKSLTIDVPGSVPGVIKIDGDGKNLSFLINGYYDFENKTSLTPFIGAGIGIAKVDIGAMSIPGSGAVTESADDTVFAYQIGAGVGFEIQKNVSLDVSYRYFATADLYYAEAEAENSSNNIYAGIRFSF